MKSFMEPLDWKGAVQFVHRCTFIVDDLEPLVGNLQKYFEVLKFRGLG